MADVLPALTFTKHKQHKQPHRALHKTTSNLRFDSLSLIAPKVSKNNQEIKDPNSKILTAPYREEAKEM